MRGANYLHASGGKPATVGPERRKRRLQSQRWQLPGLARLPGLGPRGDSDEPGQCLSRPLAGAGAGHCDGNRQRESLRDSLWRARQRQAPSSPLELKCSPLELDANDSQMNRFDRRTAVSVPPSVTITWETSNSNSRTRFLHIQSL